MLREDVVEAVRDRQVHHPRRQQHRRRDRNPDRRGRRRTRQGRALPQGQHQPAGGGPLACVRGSGAHVRHGRRRQGKATVMSTVRPFAPHSAVALIAPSPSRREGVLWHRPCHPAPGRRHDRATLTKLPPPLTRPTPTGRAPWWCMCGPAGRPSTALDAAISLARALEADVVGQYVEDQTLLSLASLSCAREVSFWRPPIARHVVRPAGN